MCTGVELFMIGSSLYGVSRSMNAPGPSYSVEAPKVDPVADDTAAQTKAAQDAAFEKLQLRERARKNSLLSTAAGAGDQTAPELGTPGATGKTTFGGA